MFQVNASKIRFLQPWVTELTRLGSQNDGGYVLSPKAIQDSDFVISAGISADWSFERALLQSRPSMPMILIDRNSGCVTFLSKAILEFCNLRRPLSIVLKEALKWLKFSARFFVDIHARRNSPQFDRYWLSNLSDKKNYSRSLTSYLEEVPARSHLLLKVDIEGAEYQILDDLASWLEKEHLVSAILIEFHNVPEHLEQLNKFLDRINDKCKVVHLHANNAAGVVDGVPEVLELSLESGSYSQQRRSLPVDGLDNPNNPNKPDITINF